MPSPANPLLVGDIVWRGDANRLRVVALYEGSDEIVVETIGDPGDIFDLCWFDVELLERPA